MRTFPHWIAAMGKCLLWNPSVKNQRFLTAPTGREPCGQCPQTISHAGVPPVAISHGNLLRIVTAPPVPGNVTAVEIDARTKAPLVKGGWFCLWQNRGDSVAKATDFFPIPSSLFPKKPSPFHMGLYFLRSACCRIPQSRLRRASSHRPGALRAVAADNAHGGFLRIVASLTRPVSLPSKMGSENMGTVHALTAAARRHYSPKNPPLCRRITT